MRIYNLMMKIAGDHSSAFKRTIILTLIAVILQTASWAVLVPFFITLNQPEMGGVWFWSGLYSCLVVAEVIFSLKAMNFTWNNWHKVIGEIRLRLGEALYRMPLLKLRQWEAGDLAEVIGGGVNVAARSLSSLGTLFIQMVTLPLMLIATMLIIDWRSGLVFLIALAILLPLLKYITHQYQKDTRHVDQSDATSAARIVEYVQGLSVFRATGQAGRYSSRLNKAFIAQQSAQHEGKRSVSSAIFLGQLISQMTLVLFIAVGGILVTNNQMSAIILCSLVVIATHIIEPLGIIAILSKVFEMSESAIERIDTLMEVEPLVQLPTRHLPKDNGIKFENVSFCYSKGDNTIQDVSLILEPGTFTGIVGPSGGGKTTLTQLITRMADPDEGRIMLGDVDIRTMTSQDLIAQISVVYQDVWLFNDTIRENILMGYPGASEAELIASAKAANIYDFINNLPSGFETKVGELGGALSGGERQRISIARAILKNAPIIILDEPTASLDSESEYEVQRALETLVEGNTVIMVAHRLHTLIGADKIILIENGVISEQGTHLQLLDARGRYYEMWESQMRDNVV
ncbi:ABC transporter ATP-binding protein [Salmonella enterica subsp. enterica]|uniref:ABC transporter ATP-binding protein n=1 Tax=Salmonella enterica subsp. enterica serovar Java TaxID=224729 RepID=A0A3Z6QK38_SALEB|nr:ABC transporter ATP-binding protein [Salmonella enterica subsp. enterica serovar Java]EBK4665417.1 ABC transporter ATP-binding protein [Salmonella enterica]ECA4660973.1 ABC transporter ATP-binding protein [Salmonella enterica subsp. enterica serovar Cerro]EEP4265992.1 ABC transporter ATP-binding protein [Salmonella enterica subsp. enterica serovar Oranienburg]EBY8643035.1 ABC transporter ATP-binding protein [Salmonella enterica subsp. enterica serovar Java]